MGATLHIPRLSSTQTPSQFAAIDPAADLSFLKLPCLASAAAAAAAAAAAPGAAAAAAAVA
jgi:hypothetical protein